VTRLPGLAEVALFGFLVALLSIPCAIGWVPRNRFFGFRVPATLRSDAVWYAINRRFGIELILIGTVLAGLAVSMEAAGLDSPNGRLIGAVAMFGSILTTTVRGWRAANRLERELGDPGRNRTAAGS
jgi:hypothetical protein